MPDYIITIDIRTGTKEAEQVRYNNTTVYSQIVSNIDLPKLISAINDGTFDKPVEPPTTFVTSDA